MRLRPAICIKYTEPKRKLSLCLSPVAVLSIELKMLNDLHVFGYVSDKTMIAFCRRNPLKAISTSMHGQAEFVYIF